MDNRSMRSVSQGSDYSEYSYTDSFTSELSGDDSLRGDPRSRLQGTLARKRFSRSRDASVMQYITPKQNGSTHTNQTDGNKNEQNIKGKYIHRQAKVKPEPDRYYTYGNYKYGEKYSSDTKTKKFITEGRNGSDRTSQFSETLADDRYRNRYRGSKGSSQATDSEDYSESTYTGEYDSSSSNSSQAFFRRKPDRLSVSFSEDTEITRPKSMQSFHSNGFKGSYQEINRKYKNNDKGILRKPKPVLKIPDDPYSLSVGVQPFQMSIPRTPSPPPVKVTPKLKTKTIKCLFEEPPIEKYKTAIIDIGERVKKEEPPEEIVVVQTDPPESEDIPSSPIEECVLRYHLPPSPEPEPVIEPIPTPPPPPYKPPKIKNNPIVIRVGGGWMQVDHHRKNHIPLIVYDRQRYNGTDSYLYIKSKYTTNRNVEPISYINKKQLLQKLQRESTVVAI